MAHVVGTYDDQGWGFSSDSTTECIEKVEAMISTAILHQEDAWNMLLSMFPDNTTSIDCAEDGESLAGVAMQSHVPEAVKEKLEKAMDWCRLAQCRLKGLITEDHLSAGRSHVYRSPSQTCNVLVGSSTKQNA